MQAGLYLLAGLATRRSQIWRARATGAIRVVASSPMVAGDIVVRIFGRSTRLLLVLLLIGSLGACETMTYDMGDGPVDAKGRSVDPGDDRNPSDLDFETENPAVPIEEEAWEDAVEDAER